MFKGILIMVIIALILFDTAQVLTATFPSHGNNSSFTPLSGETKLNYHKGGWNILYDTEEGFFYKISPPFSYQMISNNYKGETLSLLNKGVIYNTNYEPIYRIIGNNLYYTNNTYISTFKYNSLLKKYVFTDEEGEISGTVVIEGKDFLLNFTQTVDSRLYKTFLASLNYTDGLWTGFFIWNIIIIISLSIILLLAYFYEKKKAEFQLIQQSFIMNL